MFKYRGVIDQAGQRPGGVDRFCDQPVDFFIVGKVGGDDIGIPACIVQLPAECIGIVAGSVVMNAHRPAVLGQGDCDFPADAPCGAGDQGVSFGYRFHVDTSFMA